MNSPQAVLTRPPVGVGHFVEKAKPDDLPHSRREIRAYVHGRANEIAAETALAVKGLPNHEAISALPENYSTYTSRANAGVKFEDYIEHLAGRDDGADLRSDQSEFIDWVSSSLVNLVPFRVHTCSFANQTDSKRDLYSQYPEISDVCSILKCPVIDASSTDFLIIASINPFSGKLAAEIIGKLLIRATEIVPFIFVTICPVRTRDYLCAKHFVHES